jgi:thiamine-monophosphate kinase
MAEEQQPTRTDVNTLGEFGLIDHLTQRFPLRNPSSILGVGDDAAVINNGDLHTVVSTDMLVEGIHFDLMYTPLKHLGYKSVVVNLSDIYAMNAQPKQVTVSMALSNRFSVEALEEIYDGIRTACELYKVDLVGGDTTSSPKGLIVSVTAVGQAEPSKIVRRSTAQVGDLICITGNVGAAYLGLQILEREKQVYLSNPDTQPELEGHDYLIERQLKPEARRDMIDHLAKADVMPTSMIDISDGVASELFHICKSSKVGALLEESGVSIHPDAEYQAVAFNLDPITCALSGGEDYELLFTIKPEDAEKVKYLPDLYISGEIVPAEDGVMLNSKGGKLHPLTAQGWQHFNPNQ